MEDMGCIYNPSSPISLEDQLLACVDPNNSDNLNTTTTIYKEKECYLSRNDSCRRLDKTPWSIRKRDVITKLKICTYRTNPKQIASYLEELFSDYPSKPGHWFYIAQHWPPRAINRVINYLIKVENPGHVTVRNSSAYFTRLIKRRKPRKGKAYEYTGINDSCRHKTVEEI